MNVTLLRFSSILFPALALVPAAAHVLELPNKIALSLPEYLIVQQIYRGWAYVGVIVVAALLSTAALTFATRGQGAAFGAALIAFLCLAATQVIFWMFTFPVNQLTENWTSAPGAWQQLRLRWEYSHAASAACDLIALIAAICSTLWARKA